MATPEPASPDALTPALPHRRPLREIVLYFSALAPWVSAGRWRWSA